MDLKVVDELFNNLGAPGKFQMISYFMLVTNLIFVLTNNLSMVFYAAKTPHHCRLNSNETLRDFVPIVRRNNKEEFDGCRMYVTYNSSKTQACPNGWTYDLKHGENTIIAEFNLVCDDAYKSELATTIYFSGVLVGSLIYGHLADSYGRKPTLAVAQLLGAIFSFGIFIFRNYYAFVTFRFFLGIQAQACLLLAFVLSMELFQTKYRARAGMFYGIMSVTGGIVLGVLAYLIKDWKYIQLTLSFIPIIQFLLLCFVPESLRWLLLHKRYKEAEKIVHRIVSFNKLPYPEQIMERIKGNTCNEHTNETIQGRKPNIMDLFRSQSLRRKTLILIIIWFTVSVVFYGLAFNISFLFGDKYLNFAISEAVDMCAVLLIFWAAPRYGRRRPLVIAFLVCAVANVISVITTAVESDSTGVKVLGTATALVGKSSAISTLNALGTFTAELYPTVVRNISLGLNSVWTRIGGMLSPQIFLLAAYSTTSVPYGILFVLALSSAILILLLPETHNQSLMDTIDDATHKQVIVEMMDEHDQKEDEQLFHHESSV